MGDRSIASPLSTQDSTTQKNTDIYPCLERDSNPQPHCFCCLRRTRLSAFCSLHFETPPCSILKNVIGEKVSAIFCRNFFLVTCVSHQNINACNILC